MSILEVFSATYLGASPVEPENQLGSISMKTNDTLYNLYCQHKVDRSRPSIEYGDRIFVNPVEPISSFTELDMKFDLFSGAFKGSLHIDSRPLHPGDWSTKKWIRSVNGYGNISVMFGYFLNATIANLEVVFLDIPADATANVYGVVAATNSKFDYPACTSMLFMNDSANTIKVGHNGVIPLSKSRVGVPLDSRLYVDISLVCDGNQYKGTACFTPHKEDECCHTFDSRIQVKVTWNCNEDSDLTDEFDSTSEYDSEFEYDDEENTDKEA